MFFPRYPSRRRSAAYSATGGKSNSICNLWLLLECLFLPVERWEETRVRRTTLETKDAKNSKCLPYCVQGDQTCLILRQTGRQTLEPSANLAIENTTFHNTGSSSSRWKKEQKYQRWKHAVSIASKRGFPCRLLENDGLWEGWLEGKTSLPAACYTMNLPRKKIPHAEGTRQCHRRQKPRQEEPISSIEVFGLLGKGIEVLWFRVSEE